jgi:hypothetical protein
MDLPQQVDGGEKRVLSAERAKGESIEDKPRHRPQGSLPIGQLLKPFPLSRGDRACGKRDARLEPAPAQGRSDGCPQIATGLARRQESQAELMMCLGDCGKGRPLLEQPIRSVNAAWRSITKATSVARRRSTDIRPSSRA